MALSIAQYANSSNMFLNGTSNTVTGLAWSTGDIIIVAGGVADGAATISTPTNANLTFGAAETSQTGSGGAEAVCYVWKATAGSNQNTQTVTATKTNGFTGIGGLCTWVVTGSPAGTANPTSNRTESTITITTSSGSVVVYFYSDFNAAAAGRTLAAGSGTGTERLDSSDGTNVGFYAGEWVGTTAASTAFGVTSYTSLKVSHLVIEVTAGGGGGSTAKQLAALGVG